MIGALRLPNISHWSMESLCGAAKAFIILYRCARGDISSLGCKSYNQGFVAARLTFTSRYIMRHFIIVSRQMEKFLWHTLNKCKSGSAQYNDIAPGINQEVYVAKKQKMRLLIKCVLNTQTGPLVKHTQKKNEKMNVLGFKHGRDP